MSCIINSFLPALTNSCCIFPPVNETEAGPVQTVDISNPSTTKWIFRDLEPVSKYQFDLRSCTTVGCGAIVSVECTTTLETSESRWGHGPWRYIGACFTSWLRQWERGRER